MIMTALLAAHLAAGSAMAQTPLSMDTAFRLQRDSQNAYDLEFLPGGGLLVSGNFDFPEEYPNGTYRRTLLKLNAQGEMDLSFPCCFGQGKIVPWNGRFYVQSGQSLRRIQADGQLDSGFNLIVPQALLVNGISTLQGGDFHVYPDGRLLFGGYHDLNDPAHGYYQGVGYNLAWITNEGRLDTTRTHRTGNGAVFGIREYPAGTAGGLGGKFLVHHWGTQYEGQPVSKVIRIHADGSLDNNFNAPIPWGYIYDMLPLPDGRAYIAGEFRLEAGNDTIQLVRLLPDGSLDASFNNALEMRQYLTVNVDARVTCVYPIAPGLLALTGAFEEVEGQERRGICLVDTLGNLLNTYIGEGGCGSYDYQLGMSTVTYGVIGGITRAPNGQYYIWGAYHGYSDGTTNDTLQRMVTRLHGGEIGLGVAERKPETRMRLYPNPANTSLTLELEDVPHNTELVLRDALGREVMRRRLTGHATTVALHGLAGGAYMAEVQQGGKRLLPAERLVIGP